VLKLCEILKKNFDFYIWKFFSFFKFLTYFKYKENVFFFSLFTINLELLLVGAEDTTLNLNIQKYLVFTYKSISFQTEFKLLTTNVRFYTGLYSFSQIVKYINLCTDIYHVFYLTLTTVLIILISHKKITVFGENFFFLNKVLFTKNKNNIFEKKRKESNKICKNICINSTNFNCNLILKRYESKFYKIYEEIKVNLIYYSSIWARSSPVSSNLLLKPSLLITKIFEFFRDICSYFSLESGIKIVDFKIFDKIKKEIQFLPIKIFRIVRAFSRHYFTKNLREKQLIWNFEEIQILIQGSVIYCFRETLYFIQIKYSEALLIISFNRSNFIFHSEFIFLSENLDMKKMKIDKVVEKIFFFNIVTKGFILIEKFYSLNTTAFLNFHLVKNYGVYDPTKANMTKKRAQNLSYDYVNSTEAIVMKTLKTKIKMKSNNFLYLIEKKLSSFFQVDPRGILIQIKTLNEREYINFYNKKNIYTYF